jgi:glycosyltransferase involved in cell wall biosynthesis
MMRALAVHAGNIAGGVEAVLDATIRLTRARGEIDLEVALVFDGPVANALRATGARVHVFGPARMSRPLSLWTARRRLAALVAGRAPGAIVTQSAWTLGLFGGVVRRSRRPHLHWVHDTLGTGHWCERLAARHPPDLLVCNSRYSAAQAALVFPGVPHVVLYGPLSRADGPGEERTAVRRRFETPPDALVIVQVGRTDPLKGHAVLIEALGRLAGDPRWVCWQVGAPQSDVERAYWRSLENLAKERGLEGRVRFVGAQSDVTSVLRAADVYCQPNVGPEAFGLTLVEAMSEGLPIVTTGIGAAPEVVGDTGQMLVEPASPAAVAAAVQRFLGDAGLRQRVGEQGVRRARTLSDPDVAHAVLAGALETAVRKAHAA